MLPKEKSQFWLQYGAAITASITSAGYGSIMSWTSPALTYLKSENSEIPISADQISWIAPLLPIGLIIGNFLNPLFINRIGRKWTLLIFAIPQIISWLLICLTKSFKDIYIARILGGIGYGGGVCAVTVYLSEIGNPKNRGIFLTMIKFSLSFGIFYTLLLGASLSYSYMNIGHLIMPVTFMVIFFFLPDSSYFLEKNKLEEKFDIEEKSKLNPKEIPMQTKNAILIEKFIQKRDSISEKNSSSFKWKNSNVWKLFTTSNNVRALIIIICVVAQDSLSGHMTLTYFSQQMLTYEGSLLSPKKSALLLATLKLIACCLATQVVERLKRRTLYFFTGILASFSQGMIAIFFYLQEAKVNVSSFAFIPFLGLIIYETSVSLGTSNLFYVLQGELFSNEVKGLAVTFAKNTYMVFGFFSIIMYQILVDSFSTYVIFFIFFLCGTILCCVTVYIMPETKGKNMEEIQFLLKTKKYFN